MGRRLSALCAGCLALLVPLLIHAARVLPVDTGTLVAEKYAGWSGVLQLWVFDGWSESAPGLPAWLNRCAARFEKRNPGVYIQPQFVDAGAIAAMGEGGLPSPDLLLIPPGLLDEPTGLAALELPGELRQPLAHCGAWGGAVYAVPVALGGYLWAWNANLIDGIPSSWRESDATLAAPPPEPWRRWDAALLALCSGQYAEAGEGIASIEDGLPGVDLGLAPEATPAPTATPAADALLPCRLPEGFGFDGDAWRRFLNGEVAATPVTQREVRRLQALSEQGRGPDWRLAPGAGTFTDQLVCLAVADRPEGDPRPPLCARFLALVLGEECQGELCRVPAFGVTAAGSGYAPSDPLAAMEATLRSDGLRAPGCFDGGWTSACDGIVREFLSGEGESWVLWRRLGERLLEKPNIVE